MDVSTSSHECKHLLAGYTKISPFQLSPKQDLTGIEGEQTNVPYMILNINKEHYWYTSYKM